MTRVDDLILGGGFSALYAALLRARAGRTVAIVDPSPTPGGLMRSVVHHDGAVPLQFDIGTHFLLLTGDADIDAPLLDSVKPDEWVWYDDQLKEGHYYAGRLAGDTGCLDLTQHANHARLRAEFDQAPGGGQVADTLRQRWLADFGPFATEEILRPIAIKHTGKTPEQLAPTAMDIFVPPYIKLVEGEAAAAMKQCPDINRRLAYSSRDQGKTRTVKAYPREGGVGLLISGMVAQLRRLGAKLFFGSHAAPVAGWRAGDPLREIVLSGDGGEQHIRFEDLVTGLAPVPLARTFGFDVPPAPFAARTLGLAHFIAKPGAVRIDDLHWITVFDPDMRASRISLYDNYACAPTGRITVETTLPLGDAAEPGLPDRLATELVQIGVVADRSDLRLLAFEQHPAAFPVLLAGWGPRLKDQARAAQTALPNLQPFGNAAGTPFGQLALLRSIAATVGEPA